jgi:hypothetical protein
MANLERHSSGVSDRAGLARSLGGHDYSRMPAFDPVSAI